MNTILMDPIGVIHSPYKECKNLPIQGTFKDSVEAWVELKEKYTNGLTDLDGFSHCILIYYFHQSHKEEIMGKPYLEQKKHGIFAIRSPHRPNHIGLSIVNIQRIKENKLFFTEVDMIDNTPLLDIKPFVNYFDSRSNVVSGWLDKHFESRNIPDETML